jgi:hypothetical protein
LQVSDYVISGKDIFIVGHPGKRPEWWLYQTDEYGNELNNKLLPKHAVLHKDYMDQVWYLGQDSAWMVRVNNKKIVLEKPSLIKAFTDSISPILLKWKDKLFYQDYFPGQQGLMTYFKVPPSDSVYIISTVRDSLAMHLAATRMIDDYARWIADMYEKEIEAALKAGSNGGGGGEGGGSVDFSYQGNYHKPKNLNPIPILKNIIAPVFIFKNLLVQIDFYSGYITFYNDRGFKVNQIPIDFQILKRPMGNLRRIYYPLTDDAHQQVYLWTQLIDRLEIYRLDIYTGQLAEKLDLEKYQNVHNLQIANGSLYFLYNELTYPYATRLFRMDLKGY